MSQQRIRCSSQADYNNFNVSNQSRLIQPGISTTSTNISERPLSRNVGIHNPSSQSPQHLRSSPVINSGGCVSQPWSPHPSSFGSPHSGLTSQLQSRPRSLSHEHLTKQSVDGSVEHNENVSNINDECGSRPHSRISEVCLFIFIYI